MARLGESIAILDGFDLSSIGVDDDESDGRIGQRRAGIEGYFGAYDPSPDAADGRIGQTRAFPNYGAAQPVGPGMLRRTNMIQASGGGNYAGGSSWYPGAPTMPAAIGLAGFADGYGRAGLGGGYGRAGLGDGYGRAGLGACGACGTMADSDLSAAFEAYDVSPDAADGRIGQTRAFPGKEIMPGVTQRSNVIDYSGGANYSGGSSFAPQLPLMPSSVGLAGAEDYTDRALMDYMNAGSVPNVTNKINVVDPSGGANYSGGSSFAPGMPLLVSSAGLAELGALDATDGAERQHFAGKLDASARTFFDKLAGRAVMKQLQSAISLAKAQRNTAALARLGRQLAIARRVRRAILQQPNGGMISAAALSQLTARVAQQVAQAKQVAVAA